MVFIFFSTDYILTRHHSMKPNMRKTFFTRLKFYWKNFIAKNSNIANWFLYQSTSKLIFTKLILSKKELNTNLYQELFHES